MANLKNTLRNTKRNLSKNKWMSVATILVISIVFTITIFFIITAVVTRRASSYYEKKAQLMVYFVQDTPESNVLELKESIERIEGTEEVVYISEEDAVEKFVEGLSDEPELTDIVKVGTLPASLEIKAKSVDELSYIIQLIKIEKKNNNYIEEIWYFEDVVEKMKTISTVINYGGISMVVGLGIIAFVLIIITIGFNIKMHKKEIEIMHLVGGTDSYIKSPFIWEGAFYGFMGSIMSVLILVLPWYLSLLLAKDTAFKFWIKKQLQEFNMVFLIEPDLSFMIIFVSSIVFSGMILGVVGSSIAVVRYLKNENVR